MELQTIVERYAEAITALDPEVGGEVANRSTGEAYRPGFAPLYEQDAMRQIVNFWSTAHPSELSESGLGVRYPDLKTASGCDHVFTTNSATHADPRPEWGIEVKRLQFVGNNGKKNDHATQKMLSPYLKDRGLLHDAARLREHGFTARVAVVVYMFDYDHRWLEQARELHTDPAARSVVAQVAKEMHNNGGTLRPRPLIEFADPILRLRGFVIGPRAETRFDAWTHPAGGSGVVFGWEVRRPHLEPDYDPRHPW